MSEFVKRVNVEVADPLAGTVTIEELDEAVTPVEDTVTLSDTGPVKPFRLITVIVEALEDPAGMVTSVGLAETLKSTTLTIATTEGDSRPLVPVTVIV